MQWLVDNWIWVVLGGGMVAMHLFGHRGHRRRGARDGVTNVDLDQGRSERNQPIVSTNPSAGAVEETKNS